MSRRSDAPDAAPGYSAVLRHPVAFRMLAAKGVSELGDFVGLAALLLLAYQETGSVLGPAVVYAARTLPALLVATVLSGWLDVPPRRTALVVLSLAGGLLISMPAAVPRAAVAVVAAGLLGAVRAAYRSVHTAVIAESVERPTRLPFFGLSVVVNQVGQVGGVFAGASLTLAIGARTALVIDAISFLAAAIIFAGLPAGPRRARRQRPPAWDGARIIWRHPVLRAIAIATSATMLSSSLPETVAPGVAGRAWLPTVMAASAFGGAVFAFVASRGGLLDRVANQLVVAAGLSGALFLGAVCLAADTPDWALAAANALIGAGAGWLVGAQATFAHLAPMERMGQVEATIVASNIVFSGLGLLGLGWLAATYDPALAYLVAGAVLLVTLIAVRGVRIRADAGEPADVERAGSAAPRSARRAPGEVPR